VLRLKGDHPFGLNQEIMMKMIVMVMAALFAMLSVAAGDEWVRKRPRSATTTAPTPKSPVRDAARPAPAQPDSLGPAERGGPRAPPAEAQPERPASAGATPPVEVAPGERRQAGGGSPDPDAQPAVSKGPAATGGGE
jgi:hypothetical protein